MSLLFFINPKQFGAEEVAVVGGHTWEPWGGSKKRKRSRKRRETEAEELLAYQLLHQEEEELEAEEAENPTEEAVLEVKDDQPADLKLMAVVATEVVKSLVGEPKDYNSALRTKAPPLTEVTVLSLKEAIEDGWISEDEYAALEALADA